MASNEVSSGAESSSDITIHVKTPKEKKTFQVAQSILVKDLKEKISPSYNNVPISQLCLIFSGRILKDGDTLEQNNVKHDMTLHLVIKTGTAGQTSNNPQPPTPQPSQTAPPAGGQSQPSLGMGLPGLANLGMGSANFMEMQQQLQSNFMNNPEFMREMMQSPLTQSLMSNPEIFREIFMSNPQMRQLIERNPEISHMLNNPEILRQTMEIASNPAMMQELMRNQDRAMSNLESLPGGQSVLQRMYHDIQEPMLNAAEDFASNPFQSAASGAQPANQTTERSGPVPNPWAASGGTPGSAANSAARPEASGLFSETGMRTLMNQVLQHPELMRSMINSPHSQRVIQEMGRNPELASRMMAGNPLLSGDPAMREQLTAALPLILNQMQDPSMMNLLSNPEALQAIQQIQEGLERLQRAAPDLYATMNMPNFSQGMNILGGGVRPPTTTAASTTPTLSTTTTPSTNTGATSDGNSAFQQLMSSMVNRMASQALNSPPEERYRVQLDTLSNMGFVDRQANIQALIATAGDVNAAIDRLLTQNQPNQQS